MRATMTGVCLSGVLAVCGQAMAQDATFEPLGFSGAGSFFIGSRANAVSPDGSTTVGGDDTDLGTRASYWPTSTLFPELLFSPAGDFAYGTATGVSEDGEVIIGWLSTTRDGSFIRLATVWNDFGLGVELDALPEAMRRESLFTTVNDVSNDGAVAVGASMDERANLQPVTWDTSTGEVSPLSLLPGRTGGSARFISGDGSIIIGQQSGGGSGSFVRWIDGVPAEVSFDLPAGFEDFSIGCVSPDGSVAGGVAFPIMFDPIMNPMRAAIWREGSGITLLDTLSGGDPGMEDVVNAISANGQFAVGRVGVGSGAGPFSAGIWFEDGSVRLLSEWLVDEYGLFEVEGWRGLLEATGISDDGRVIVGFGINPIGIKEGWKVTLPSTVCAVDLDEDGALTVFDFLLFQNLFDDQDPRADIDGDGQFTIFDFLKFQTLFDAGCP
ncbi:MAG: GC-type dockerin domain-anchored protein [Phycisphaerales bacterium JB064]